MMRGMDLYRPISELEITVLDYESTGTLDGYQNEAWQIGMVTLKNGKVDVASQFESLLRVDATRPFNPYAPGRHALLRKEIALAPSQQELWPQIKGRLTDHPLCAHNVGTEKKFTRLAAPMHSFGPWIDTLRIARAVWKKAPSYALDDLIPMLGLTDQVEKLCPNKEAHDALYDAVASALLLEHLLSQPGWGEITLEQLISL